ncbi:MAG: PD-(D/E)XK nuclease family protein [Candidatus Altiarchaeia archaeon]
MLYSYSRIKRFEKCPLAYRFEYIDKVKIEEFDTIEAFMGSRVHEALDVFYGEALGGKILSLMEVLDLYDGNWQEKLHPGVVVNSQDRSCEDYHAAGAQCIRDYYDNYSPFDQTEVLGTEIKVLVDLLGDGRYKFIGYIDRLDRTKQGAYEIHDYKTGGSVPSKKKTGSDQQLALYELGIRQKHADVSEVELVWHYLRHNREIRSKKTVSDLEALKTGFVSAISGIEKATVDDFFPANKTRLCKWCAYQGICLQEKRIPMRQTSLAKYIDPPQDRYYEFEAP